jgi:hypothetical protein
MGCIDYGNNNFFEIMMDSEHKVILCAHGDDPCEENEDGTFNCEGLTINEFLSQISNRSDYHEIVKELMETFE